MGPGGKHTFKYKKINLLHMSSANWIFTVKHAHFSMISQEVALILTHFNLMLINFVSISSKNKQLGNDPKYLTNFIHCNFII